MKNNKPVTIPFLGSLGGSFIILGSFGSTPNAKAGTPSVIRLIHNK